MSKPSLNRPAPIPTTDAPTPDGAGIALGTKFHVDKPTGTLRVDIPFPVPPGRNGFAPELALRYQSDLPSRGFGSGWELSIPKVRRSVERDFSGEPAKFNKDDQFYIEIYGTKSPLVEIKRSDSKIIYIAWYEGQHVRAEHQYRHGDFWRLFLQNGECWTFGPSPPHDNDEHHRSNISDPNDPSVVIEWNLTRVTDACANRMDFDWISDRSPGNWNQTYLELIRYIDYGPKEEPSYLVEVRFERDTRADPVVCRLNGIPQSNNLLCRRIHCHSLAFGDVLVSSFDLGYATSEATNESVLTSVTQCGHDQERVERLPPVEFAYAGKTPRLIHINNGRGAQASVRYDDTDTGANSVPVSTLHVHDLFSATSRTESYRYDGRATVSGNDVYQYVECDTSFDSSSDPLGRRRTRTRQWFHPGVQTNTLGFAPYVESTLKGHGGYKTLASWEAMRATQPSVLHAPNFSCLRGHLRRRECYHLRRSTDSTDDQLTLYEVEDCELRAREYSDNLWTPETEIRRVTKWDDAQLEPRTVLNVVASFDHALRPTCTIELHAPRGQSQPKIEDGWSGRITHRKYAQSSNDGFGLIAQQSAYIELDLVVFQVKRSSGIEPWSAALEEVFDNKVPSRPRKVTLRWFDQSAALAENLSTMTGPGLLTCEQRMQMTEEHVNTFLDAHTVPYFFTTDRQHPIVTEDSYPTRFLRSMLPKAGHIFREFPEYGFSGWFSNEQFMYDSEREARGLMVGRMDERGGPYEYYYDPYRIFATATITPDGLISRQEPDYHSFRPAALEDANDVVRSYTYSPLGKLTSLAMLDPFGMGDPNDAPSTIWVYYWGSSNLKEPGKSVHPSSCTVYQRRYYQLDNAAPTEECEQVRREISYYDGFGRLLETRQQSSSVSQSPHCFATDGDAHFDDWVDTGESSDQTAHVITSIRYDGCGLTLAQTMPHRSADWKFGSASIGQPRIHTLAYDCQARLTESNHPLRPVEYHYPSAWSVVETLSDKRRYTKVQTPDGYEYTYDGDINAPNATEKSDQHGNPVERITADGSVEWKARYDLHERTVFEQSNGEIPTICHYDASGLLVEQRSAYHRQIRAYDPAGNRSLEWQQCELSPGRHLQSKEMWQVTAVDTYGGDDAPRGFRGRLCERYDQTGHLRIESYSIMSEPELEVRKFIRGEHTLPYPFRRSGRQPKKLVNWSVRPKSLAENLLAPQEFVRSQSYDALGKLVQTHPAQPAEQSRYVIQHHRNACGQLIGLDVVISGAEPEPLFLVVEYDSNNRRTRWCTEGGLVYEADYAVTPTPAVSFSFQSNDKPLLTQRLVFDQAHKPIHEDHHFVGGKPTSTSFIYDSNATLIGRETSPCVAPISACQAREQAVSAPLEFRLSSAASPATATRCTHHHDLVTYTEASKRPNTLWENDVYWGDSVQSHISWSDSGEPTIRALLYSESNLAACLELRTDGNPACASRDIRYRIHDLEGQSIHWCTTSGEIDLDCTMMPMPTPQPPNNACQTPGSELRIPLSMSKFSDRRQPGAPPSEEDAA